MIVIGLTGSIGMGKTTAATMFARMNIPVHDSDRAVHELLAPGGAAVAAVARAFPKAHDRKQNAINRAALARIVFADPEKRRALEAILHPLVRDSQNRFLALQQRRRAAMAVLDIPLLFETGAESRVDYTIVVTAPAFIQRQRVMARPGMTEEAFYRRLASQMPDAEKRRRADFIVQTGNGRACTYRALQKIVRDLNTQEIRA